MKVLFSTNVGSLDAEAIGLDFKRCCEGMTLDVSDTQAATLLRRKFAVEVEIKAAPKPPESSEPKSAKHK